METLDAIVFIIHTLGFFGGITLWLIAMNKAVSDDVHFKLTWVWKVKREWFRPPGYQLYVTAVLIFGIGILTGSIYWTFFA